MIKLNKPSDCCGCTACASVCSHNAITMKPDALGFLYPVVDKISVSIVGYVKQYALLMNIMTHL